MEYSTCVGEVIGFDHHGFAVFNDKGGPDIERCHDYRCVEYTPEQLSSLVEILANWDDHSTRDSRKLHNYLKRGFPTEYRATLWKKLLEVDAMKACSNYSYQDTLSSIRHQLVDLGISEYSCGEALNLLGDVECGQYKVKYGQLPLDCIRHIILDLHRSFPTHRMFMGSGSEAREGRAALFRVLAAYAKFNLHVGYCQGMSSIAGVFLMYMTEEEAFWCMVSLLERHKYLVGYFNKGMERFHLHAAVFNELLQLRFPELHKHMTSCDINPLMFLTSWFMGLFTGLMCWDTVLAIWDFIFLQGNKALFKVSLAIVEKCNSLLTLSDHSCISKILPQLLHPPVQVVKHEVLVAKMWSVTIEDWEVGSLLTMIDDDNILKSNAKKRHLSDKLNNNKSDKKRKVDEDTFISRFKSIFIPKAQQHSQSTSRSREHALPPRTPRRSPRIAAKTTPSINRSASKSTRRRSSISSKTPRKHDIQHKSSKTPHAVRKTPQKCARSPKRQSNTPQFRSPKRRNNTQLRTPLKDTLNTVHNVIEVVPSAKKKLLKELVALGSNDGLKGEHMTDGISPCEVASENSFAMSSQVGPAKSTPRRRSPRVLAKSLLNQINSITNIREKYAFQIFSTPLSLNSRRLLNTSTPPSWMNSPETELKNMK